MIEEYEITPLGRRFVLKTPFSALTWLRPEGVQVRAPDGRYQIQRVRDRTRLIQIALTLLLVLAGRSLLSARSRST